ncbi:MAG: energy transducer TonB [Candidatus Aminicenantes bacterium]|nr:energy transducer TonB [Candidatus Aminicenantes bacterium]
MNKKTLLLGTIFLMGLSFVPLKADVNLDIKIRFFAGVREGMAEPPQFVTSSYLQPTVTASIKSKFELAEEQKQIKKIFNLKEVSLITEADLRWKSKYSDKIFHIFRLDSKEYLLLITPVSPVRKSQFRIEVFEQSEKGKINLLDTEIILPEKNIAVFGFEDVQGKPYFLSFHTSETRLVGVVEGEIKPPRLIKRVSPIYTEEAREAYEEFAKGAVKAEGEIKPPRLIKRVSPIYPEEAREAKIQGVVILSARTDEKGNVEAVQVLKSVDPLLDQAAIDTVKQWKYEPFIKDGKPHKVVFTITVVFKLK